MDQVVAWWDGLDELARVGLRDGGIVTAALIVALVAGALVRLFLVAKGVDEYLRFPWATQAPAPTKEARPEQPGSEQAPVTRVAGWFVAVSVCACAGWWLAELHDARSTAHAILTITVRAWQMAVIIFPILMISGWLARTLYDLLHTPWVKAEMDSLFPGTSEGGSSFSDTIAKALCVVIYAAFFLLIPVAIAAIFNISVLEGLVVPAWQICARLLTALVVFAVGYLGVAWARSHAERIGGQDGGETNADLGHQVSLGVILFTVILALGMLVGVSGFAGALVVIAVLAFLLWPVRSYMRDLWAGILLRVQRVKQVELDGASVDIKAITPLATHMERQGVELTRRNWDVLTLFSKGSEKRSDGAQDDAILPIDGM